MQQFKQPVAAEIINISYAKHCFLHKCPRRLCRFGKFEAKNKAGLYADINGLHHWRQFKKRDRLEWQHTLSDHWWDLPVNHWAAGHVAAADRSSSWSVMRTCPKGKAPCGLRGCKNGPAPFPGRCRRGLYPYFRWVSLKTDRTTAQQTAQLEGDDNVHAHRPHRRPHRRPHSNAAEKFSYLKTLSWTCRHRY